MTLCLVTGATGCVGSHVSERLIQERHRVRTLVRPASDTAFLDRIGVDKLEGDMTDAAALRRAVEGVRIVVHCAAKVGDWGAVEEYRRVNVQGLRDLLDAAAAQKLDRFVQISSLGVYEARDHFGTDESVEPGAHHIDGYTQTKYEAEKLVLEYHRTRSLPVTVLRPGLIYGPRDRTVVPRLLENIRIGRFRYFGSGEQAMNSIYVGNLVDAVMLATATPAAIGQVYNLTDDDPTSKRRFFGTAARLAGYPEPTRSIPLGLARFLAAVMEGIARLTGKKEAPLVNQARIKFLGLNLGYSCEKAKRELGYKPRWSFDEGMKATIDWFRGEGLISPLSG
ncbi:MAG: NAD-dependent epimerase/dehydratase family protein [Planctomycetes bacterium]|nr:NAD-dependent epimerase/dehydratase family protein [Planctomycetota bacterium]